MTFEVPGLRGARERPAHDALRFGSQRQTYGQLAAAVTAFARRLQALGVRPGEPVAIIAPKRLETVIAMLGTLRAGAFYVPLDPRNPIERLTRILRDCRARVIVAPPASWEGLRSQPNAEGWTWLDLGSVALGGPGPEAQTDPAAEASWPQVEGSAPAYCLYTSGSTGAPKGVLISRQALAHFLDSMNECMGVGPDARCLNTSPFFFDVSVADVLLPLAKMATVFLTGDVFSPPAIMHLLRQHEITHFCAVSSLMNLMAANMSSQDFFPALRTVMTGAEILNVGTVRQWLERAPGATLINGYGPTEATCVCLAHPVRPGDLPADVLAIPIGRPLRGMEARVIDAHGAPLAQGEVGELIVAGPQLMLGYLANEGETLRRTIWVDGLRFYRTGDLVRQQGEAFHFVGRNDEEVKVKGYRFHLSEVRQALLSMADLRDCVVEVTEAEGRKTLRAAVISGEVGREETLARVHQRLRQLVPEYMVPDRVVVVSSFPRLPSGKIDRNAVFGAELLT